MTATPGFWGFAKEVLSFRGPEATASGSINDDAQYDRNSVRITVMRILLVLAIGLVLASLRGSLRSSASTFGLHILVAVGAICGGAAIGFLFGIPRALQNAEAPKDNGGPTQLINTNLEQISDWLTKIIVGISLVQAHTLFSLLVRASARIGQGIDGTQTDLATATVALTIVTSFVVGFLAMYIETRTFLSPMFQRAAEIEQRIRRNDVVVIKATPVATSKAQQAPLSADQRAALERTADQPIGSAKTPDELGAWAKARFWRGDYTDAAQGYAQALSTKPDDYRMRREAARALVLAGQVDAGIAEFEYARAAAAKAGDSSLTRELDIDRVWARLYKDPVEGFEGAIGVADDIIRNNPALANDPRLQTYIAAAQGQAYDWYSTQEDASKAHEAAEHAKEAITKVLASPNADTWWPMLKLLAAGTSPSDDDLKALAKERPEIRQLIERGKAS